MKYLRLIRDSTSKTHLLSTGIGAYLGRSSSRCSSQNAISVSGMYPPIPTPFAGDKMSISYDQLASNFDKWNKMPFGGYVVQGSNGEYPFLSTEERVELIKHARKMIPKDKLLIAGSGCESTTATIEMTQKMADCGADVALVITPFYYKSGMTQSGLSKHYEQVADQSPIPILIYNVTVNTGLDLPINTILRLSNHKNIIGMKDSNGDVAKLATLINRTKAVPGGFQVLAGSASFLLPAYSIGCVGGVCALANILGKEVCNVQELFEAGKLQDAKVLQQRLVAPNVAVTREYGVPGLKAALDAFGYYGGPTRLPLEDLDDQKKSEVLKIFHDSCFYQR
ncbi:4-hydroxy-2-oxoglutarate aldolase, mitochondrial-like [Styela clava]